MAFYWCDFYVFIDFIKNNVAFINYLSNFTSLTKIKAQHNNKKLHILYNFSCFVIVNLMLTEVDWISDKKITNVHRTFQILVLLLHHKILKKSSHNLGL